MITFRLLNKDDIPAAVEVVRENYPHKPVYAEELPKELMMMFGNTPLRPVYIVAEEAGQFVGFMGFMEAFADYPVCEMAWVNVAHGRHGQGIGKRLVQHTLETIRTRPTPTHYVLISARPEVQEYYAKNFGFKRLDEFGPDGYCLMGRRL